MLSGKNELALRKELLLVQSALHRAQLKYEIVALREKVTIGSGWISRVLTIVSIARTVFSFVSLLRR
ncbi:hypothetical protein BWI17_07050 [Betaproteobacteria bacterium GR16-43]|nr:hypothetical protein BWI17_07050 [Betaproteobacteria bacterium GR16-43]